MTGRTDGERWARDELRRLRDAGFAPEAATRFLRASARRAGDARRARPALAGQSRRWSAAGGAAWCALAMAGRGPFRRRLAPGLAWWSAVALMLDWHLGMLETEDGAPRALGPADALTLARAWLAPAVADDLDPRLLALAFATDALDGVVARATAPTRAGRDLEGLADAAVYLAALRAGARTGRLARAAVVLEAARLAAGGAFTAWSYFARAAAPSPAVTRAGRRTTPLRFAGLLAAAAGRRGSGSVLLGAGSLAGLAAVARGLDGARASRRSAPARSG